MIILALDSTAKAAAVALLCDEKLIAKDTANAEALVELKANYEAQVKELKDKDLATDKAIADLDAKYQTEVEKLIAQDSANAEALAELKWR